jgi:hypothetical protein
MIEMTALDPKELSRTYHWADGFTLTLNDVTHFNARNSGTHRLQTLDGKLHIVNTGWRHIVIDAKSFTV